MEKNVTISLDEFNELKSFRDAVEEGNKIYTEVVIMEPDCFPSMKFIDVRFYTKDEVIKALSDANTELIQDKRELKHRLKALEGVSKLMSIWQFIKWRKEPF